MKDALTEKQEQRWAMLKKYYDLTNGQSEHIVNLWQVGEQLAWTRDLARATYEYLKNEGLVEAKALGGASSLTHRGVKEVEAAQQGKETEHFAPNFVFNINSPGSNIIAGTHIDAKQTNVNMASQAAQLRDALLALESPLPQEATAFLAAAETPTPDKYAIARTAEALSNKDPKWKEGLMKFCTSVGAGLLVEAIKFGLGM